MRQSYLLFLSIMLFLLIGCNDNDTSYPASDMPEITVERNELYSVPNRKFTIKANLKDDLGLKSLRIYIPELYLDKEILFPTDELLTEYKLEYQFLAPADTKETETYKVNLTLTDVSENSVSKELNLKLDGDFNAPALSNIKPINGSVIFMADDMKVNVAFNVTDVTGIDSVLVYNKELGINEKIKVGGGNTYSFAKTYPVPAELKSYDIAVTTVDNFVEPNRGKTTIKFSVSEGLTEMFLADVSKDTDLTADVFGVPMYFHTLADGVFTFKYYADSDNKEIYFLGQEASFEPHCFGAIADGKLENSDTAPAVVLPTKGYYLITVDPAALTYTATPYTPESVIHTPGNITICGSGFVGAGWDSANTDFLVSANPENPYQLYRASMPLNGTDLSMTISAPGWTNPWWRLETEK
ncbi:hypothetical protein [Bacteroides sp. 519]|uniref:hypothetical protein n=1 Tax=Bacteroides sp. 519 TaxID=2302937 RepID=UPI001EF2B289|nr:hypothetical protein [Bacteroides sp. 519]